MNLYDFNIPKTHSFVADNIIVSNCGVRTLKSNLTLKDIQDKKQQLADSLFKTVPAGLGSKGDIHLTMDEIDEVLVKGAEIAVNGKEGKHNISIIEAIYESIETGQEVTLRFKPTRCKLGVL